MLPGIEVVPVFYMKRYDSGELWCDPGYIGIDFSAYPEIVPADRLLPILGRRVGE
jgi:hypothetical protein